MSDVQKLAQENARRREKRRVGRDDLIKALDELQGLTWHRDQLRKRIAETGARRDLVPFDKQIVIGQLRTTLAAVESDLITARARAQGLQREFG